MLKHLINKKKQVILQDKLYHFNYVFCWNCFHLFSRASLSALKPNWWEILGYKPMKSAVTSIAFSKRVLIFLTFYIKCPESLIYDLKFYITSVRFLSNNLDTFSVGIHQSEISLLWILGNMDIFPRLRAFLYSYVKYFISFFTINIFFLRPLKNMLLVSIKFDCICFLNWTFWCTFSWFSSCQKLVSMPFSNIQLSFKQLYKILCQSF